VLHTGIPGSVEGMSEKPYFCFAIGIPFHYGSSAGIGDGKFVFERRTDQQDAESRMPEAISF